MLSSFSLFQYVFIAVSALLAFTPVVYSAHNGVHCYSPPGRILAPRQDCEDVLMDMRRHYQTIGMNWNRTWGRNVIATDWYNVQLPHGFQLTRSYPRPLRKRCEIHVDNRLGEEERTDRFTMDDLIGAGMDILNRCYYRGLTGYAYPSGRRIVYVTTINIPENGITDAGSNVTLVDSPRPERESTSPSIAAPIEAY